MALVVCSCSATDGSAMDGTNGTNGGPSDPQGPGGDGGGAMLFGADAGNLGAEGGTSTSDGGGPGVDGGSTTPTDVPTIAGCPIFTAGDAWNQDISHATADATWTSRLQTASGGVNLHPDFGSNFGIPINVVPQTQAMVPITYDQYGDESDPGPYPLPGPGTLKIEGGTPASCSGDCHIIVLQQGTCSLFEGWACRYSSGWICGNGARWNAKAASAGQRPVGWTSADVAGLSIAAGLARFSEVQAGEIKHAIRFTLPCSRPKYVSPATHEGVPGSCNASDPNALPMGMRIRLKASFNMSAYNATAKVFLTAMQKYGMILADNGSPMYLQSEENAGWNDGDLNALKNVPSSAFEVITPGPLGG
ncbi:MAG: hypothetical protein ABIP39_03375 [Polyangiaceae bacterium]